MRLDGFDVLVGINLLREGDVYKRQALRMPDTSEVARDFSLAWSLLLLRFVVYEDSNLRLAGSDSYLAEVFPRYQCRHYDG